MSEVTRAIVLVVNIEFRVRHGFVVDEAILRQIIESDDEFCERMREDYGHLKLVDVGDKPLLDTYERDWARDLFAQFIGFEGWPTNGSSDKETDKRFAEALSKANEEKLITILDQNPDEDTASDGADTGLLINFVERLTNSEITRLSALIAARMSELGIRPEMNLPRPKSVYLTGFDKDRYREVLDCVRYYVPRMGILAARKHLDDVMSGERRMLSLTLRTWEAEDFKAALEAVGGTVAVEWY